MPSLFFRFNNSARRLLGFGEKAIPRVEGLIYNVICSKSADSVELTTEQSEEYLRMLEEEYEIVRQRNIKETQINDSSRDTGSSRNNTNQEIFHSEKLNGR